MARLFKGTCAACGHTSPLMPHDWLAVRLRSGCVEVLGHPGEQRQLEALGFTWDEARREGRLLRRVAGLCVDCSTTIDLDADDQRIPKRHLAWPEDLVIVGGLISVAAAVAGTLSADPAIGLGWRLLMVPGVVALALFGYGRVVQGVGNIIEKYRRPVLASLPASSIPCEHCIDGRVYPLELLAERPLICPACSRRDYSVRAVAVS